MNFIFSNFFIIFFAIVVVMLIYSRFKGKKDAATKAILHQQAEEEAQSRDIKVTAHADGRLTSGGEITGDTNYEGTTGGIHWTLTSTMQSGSSTHGTGGSHVWKRKSVWRSAAIPMPPGKFIMLMSTPGEIKTGPINRGGLINNIINKAADAVLDLYVTGYFGSAYCPLVNIGDDGVKLEREGLSDFMILTNHEALAQSYFDEATTKAISHWKQSNQGFSQEAAIDQFGLLFSPDGTMLSCQTSMANAEEVKKFSDFGAVLTAKMKSILV